MKVHCRRISKIRNRRGASVILVLGCAVLLVLAVWLGFRYCLMINGSNEVRNAVDAAALNVSKRASELKVPLAGLYADCGDNYHEVGLANINRVWGKAFLINANQQDMVASGMAGPYSASNADQAYTAAQSVNDALARQLNSKDNLDVYFNKLAGTRPANMLGKDAAVKTTSDSSWATSLVDRGAESNLDFVNGQLPPSVHVNPVIKAGKQFFAGYQPFQANNKSFCMATFKYAEMPHLISDAYFEMNRGDVNPIGTVHNPIPNAFKESGEADGSQASLSAVASAVANPMKKYNLAIPYSYVSIQFSNTAKWFVEGKLVTTTIYTNTPEKYWEVKLVPLPPPPKSSGGKLNGYAQLGQEFERPDIWDVINVLPGDHANAFHVLLQRIQEFQPNYSMNQLKTLLQNTNVDPSPAATTYYLFPVYKTTDLTDPNVQSASNLGSLPPWLGQNPPDGSAASVATEGPLEDKPNFDWETIIGGNISSGQHKTICSGNILWCPGTGGKSQCLGTMLVARQTNCYFSGQK